VDSDEKLVKRRGEVVVQMKSDRGGSEGKGGSTSGQRTCFVRGCLDDRGPLKNLDHPGGFIELAFPGTPAVCRVPRKTVVLPDPSAGAQRFISASSGDGHTRSRPVGRREFVGRKSRVYNIGDGNPQRAPMWITIRWVKTSPMAVSSKARST